jgi:uncharacterized protein YdcH (DUF465 family)
MDVAMAWIVPAGQAGVISPARGGSMKLNDVAPTAEDTLAQAGSMERLERAEARHRQLDARLTELRRRAYLSPAEQRELVEVKKQKLRAKDEVSALRASAQSS